MATLATTYLTLADILSREEDGKVSSQIIEMLQQTNSILDDAVVVECNDGSTHLTTARTGLPSATWRKLYQGVQPSKSTTRQVRDTVGMLEAWSEIDAKLVDISGDPAGVRLSEAAAFLEALNIEMGTGVFYHNTQSNPEKFMGLTPRMNSLSAENSSNIVNVGGSSNANTSIWFVGWSDRTVHLLYPRGSKAGIQREDKGKTTKTNSDGSLYDVYREKFTWDIGMSLRDWRYVVRVGNIDYASIASTYTDEQVLTWLRKAYWKLHARRLMGGKFAIYANADILELIDRAFTNKTNVWLTRDEASGAEVLKYRGIPIRQCDAILNTETNIGA